MLSTYLKNKSIVQYFFTQLLALLKPSIVMLGFFLI